MVVVLVSSRGNARRPGSRLLDQKTQKSTLLGIERRLRANLQADPPHRGVAVKRTPRLCRSGARKPRHSTIHRCVVGKTGNDPSAGSPTETLLRLLLPLNVKVYSTFRKERRNCKPRSPKYSPEHSIGRSDGRCVQRAGT